MTAWQLLKEMREELHTLQRKVQGLEATCTPTQRSRSTHWPEQSGGAKRGGGRPGERESNEDDGRSSRKIRRDDEAV